MLLDIVVIFLLRTIFQKMFLLSSLSFAPMWLVFNFENVMCRLIDWISMCRHLGQPLYNISMAFYKQGLFHRARQAKCYADADDSFRKYKVGNGNASCTS